MRAPEGAETAATHHYQLRADLLGEPHDLRIRTADPRVCPLDIAPDFAYLLHLLLKSLTGFFGDRAHPVPVLGVGDRCLRVSVDARHSAYVDDVQLGSSFFEGLVAILATRIASSEPSVASSIFVRNVCRFLLTIVLLEGLR